MKATIAVTCFFSAVVLISALTEEECRAPRAFSYCDPNVPPELLFYFNNGTDKCESDVGCGTGKNKFPSLQECEEGCPFGRHASSA
uniref:Putative tick kunitz 43 n=1 Tax=Ixodes ricinus TaxID=34613 RepID=V5HVU3_IXORI